MTTTTLPTNALEALEATARYIETHRWSSNGAGSACKYEYDAFGMRRGTKKPCVCLEEALAIVCGRDPEHWGRTYSMDRPERGAYEALRVEGGNREPWEYNDSAGRDKRKVVRFVRRTARKLAAQVAA